MEIYFVRVLPDSLSFPPALGRSLRHQHPNNSYSPFGQTFFSLHHHFYSFFWSVTVLVSSVLESLSNGQEGGKKKVIALWSSHWLLTSSVRALLASELDCSSLGGSGQTGLRKFSLSPHHNSSTPAMEPHQALWWQNWLWHISVWLLKAGTAC